MLLNHGESILFSAEVEREHDGRGGRLTLTNVRLVLEVEQSRGLLGGKSTVLDYETGLLEIRDVQASRRAIGRPILQVQAMNGLIRLKTTMADTWAQTISRARASVPPPPPPPPHGGYGSPVVVNVAAPSAAPPPPPLAVFLHCRMCGTLSPAGSGGRCRSCGAAL